MKRRLDIVLRDKGMVLTRSQAESYVRLGLVTVNGNVVMKAGRLVSTEDHVQLAVDNQYVSRAALKLKSADQVFHIDWQDKTVLDVGSSTGGFTQYALQHGVAKVIAVDVGTNQMHPSLRNDERIELHEKTDIRTVWLRGQPDAKSRGSHREAVYVDSKIDIVVCDVSFISLREILPHVVRLLATGSKVVVMVKPQFEAGAGYANPATRAAQLLHKGVVKNDRLRRDILKAFEEWVKDMFIVQAKSDSAVAGAHGNLERFYLLRR